MKQLVKERQLLLKDELVRAALMGLKHATWRPLRRQPPLGYDRKVSEYVYDPTLSVRFENKSVYDPLTGNRHGGMYTVRCPHGQPGDRLYVREAWNLVKEVGQETMTDLGPEVSIEWDTWEGPIPKEHPEGWLLVYRADQDPGHADGPWRPSLHMPRWASRILYRIEAIEARRIHSVTLEEIKRDGIMVPGVKKKGGFKPMIRLTGKFPPPDYVSNALSEWTEDDLYRAYFASLWDEAYYQKGYGWWLDPWCWHIKMKKLRGRKTDFPKQVMIGFGSKEK